MSSAWASRSATKRERVLSLSLPFCPSDVSPLIRRNAWPRETPSECSGCSAKSAPTRNKARSRLLMRPCWQERHPLKSAHRDSGRPLFPGQGCGSAPLSAPHPARRARAGGRTQSHAGAIVRRLTRVVAHPDGPSMVAVPVVAAVPAIAAVSRSSPRTSRSTRRNARSAFAPAWRARALVPRRSSAAQDVLWSRARVACPLAVGQACRRAGCRRYRAHRARMGRLVPRPPSSWASIRGPLGDCRCHPHAPRVGSERVRSR